MSEIFEPTIMIVPGTVVTRKTEGGKPLHSKERCTLLIQQSAGQEDLAEELYLQNILARTAADIVHHSFSFESPRIPKGIVEISWQVAEPYRDMPTKITLTTDHL